MTLGKFFNLSNFRGLSGPLENSSACHGCCSLMVGWMGEESWSGSVVRGSGEQMRKGPIQAQDQGTLNEYSAWLKVTMGERVDGGTSWWEGGKSGE